MEDILLDDEFKSDKFKVSLNELMFSRTYSPSINSIHKLLDDNGYFGRYKIETIDNRKFGTDILIRVHVYLFDSVYTYVWPYSTFFNIDKRNFGHNRRTPRGILTDKSMLGYVFTLLASIFKKRTKNYSPSILFEKHCDACFQTIVESKISIHDWPFVICKIHDTRAHKPYLEKAIPFLAKVGLISNNKFKLTTVDDAHEVFKNLFDIDYWHNI